MSANQTPKLVLVTGATGFIGAHIVDTLLSRGIKVRGATRSLAKGDAMIKARPQYATQLEFVQIDDFENPGGLVEAVEGVDGIIHTASVGLTTWTQDKLTAVAFYV
jgi:nucleoside-diphosphate-sugar epimerase